MEIESVTRKCEVEGSLGLWQFKYLVRKVLLCYDDEGNESLLTLLYKRCSSDARGCDPRRATARPCSKRLR